MKFLLLLHNSPTSLLSPLHSLGLRWSAIHAVSQKLLCDKHEEPISQQKNQNTTLTLHDRPSSDILVLFPSLFLMRSYPKETQAQFKFPVFGEPLMLHSENKVVQCHWRMVHRQGAVCKLFIIGPEEIRSLSQNINQLCITQDTV